MEDLANERDAVCRRIRQFNFEPVHAEQLSPSGAGSWERLRDEILSSDLFVLILGHRYGWIPDSGPMAGTGKSVTELEFDEASNAGIPIFPFFKQPTFATQKSPDTALERFRARVEDWHGGRFRGQFVLAQDLADQVGQALGSFLGDWYLQRGVDVRRKALDVEAPAPREDVDRTVELPEALVAAVARRDVTLFVGAGISLSAGLPSAAAFIEALAARIRGVDPSYAPSAGGSRVNAVATDLELLTNREYVAEAAQAAVDPAFASPTEGHRCALGLFDKIVTTNFDLLLERAMSDDSHTVVATEVESEELPSRVIVKFHGSIDQPESLVLSELDLAHFEEERPNLRRLVRYELARRPTLVVGTALRDLSVIRLFESAALDMRGWFVANDLTDLSTKRLERWRLRPVLADAEAFFPALAEAVSAYPRQSGFVRSPQ